LSVLLLRSLSLSLSLFAMLPSSSSLHCRIVRNADRSIAAHDHNRKYMELVLRDCPPEYGDVVVGEGEYVLSYDGMVALHAKVRHR
jgi:hypothetical protein